jgi:hypothetical protein
MAKTRDEEWFTDDQAQWHEDQKRDEEELRLLREQSMRAAIKRELMDEVVEEFTNSIKPEIDEAAVKFGKKVFKLGFAYGFVTALTGAVLFFLFV